MKRIDLHLSADQEPDDVAEVGDDHHERSRELELVVEGRVPHFLDRHVDLLPKVVAVAVGGDVVLSESRGALVEGVVPEDECVAVVVDVRERDLVASFAEDPQLPGLGGVEDVWEEESVAGPVDLVRGDGDRHELVAASLSHRDLPHGL